jgi:hypothetical protein
MGKNLALELSEEEKNELLMDLFREWWLSATKALVEHVGSSKALSYLAPGFRHHGRAGFQIIAKSMGWKEDDLSAIAIFEPFAKTIISGKPANAELREDGVIWTVQGCSTLGKCKEACLSWCYHAGVGMIEEFDQSVEYYLHESLSQGDDRCLGSIEKNGHGLPSGRIIQSYSLETSDIKKLDWNFWSRAAMGEVWAIVTRASVECLGEQEALSVLNPLMQESGMILGNLMRKKIGDVEARDNIYEIVVLIQSCFDMKGKETKAPYSGEISICPFSGSPVETCHQFEAFLNGFCMAIDPDLEFVYDRMMSEGDGTCHWTIRRRGGLAKERSKDEPASSDPIKRLTDKYIDGEISEEDFRKKLAVLKELRL